MMAYSIYLSQIKDPWRFSDRHTYEKAFMVMWLEENRSSPITKEHILSNSIHTDFTMGRLIEIVIQFNIQNVPKKKFDTATKSDNGTQMVDTEDDITKSDKILDRKQ